MCSQETDKERLELEVWLQALERQKENINEEFYLKGGLKKMTKNFTTDALLRLSDVEAIAGYKKSKIYNLMAELKFPQPIRLGRSVRWKFSEINSWINSLSSQEAGR